MLARRAAVVWSANALEAFAQSGVLVKPDHPRSIDRYIDYFGGSSAPSSTGHPALEPADRPRASAGGEGHA